MPPGSRKEPILSLILSDWRLRKYLSQTINYNFIQYFHMNDKNSAGLTVNELPHVSDDMSGAVYEETSSRD